MLADANNKRLKLLGPTQATLSRLAQTGTYAGSKANAEAFPIREIMPVITEEDGSRWGEAPEDHGYPGIRFRVD